MCIRDRLQRMRDPAGAARGGKQLERHIRPESEFARDRRQHEIDIRLLAGQRRDGPARVLIGRRQGERSQQCPRPSIAIGIERMAEAGQGHALSLIHI